MAKKIRYRGQEYILEDGKTIADVKQALGIPQDYILVDDRGRKLRNNQKVEELEEGSGVMPLVQPKYG